MWYSLIVHAILSIILICIVHQLWEYCKINYTSPKTKDVIGFQESKYRQMVEDIDRNSTALVTVPTNPVNIVSSSLKKKSEFLKVEESEWINDELAAFINTL